MDAFKELVAAQGCSADGVAAAANPLSSLVSRVGSSLPGMAAVTCCSLLHSLEPCVVPPTLSSHCVVLCCVVALCSVMYHTFSGLSSAGAHAAQGAHFTPAMFEMAAAQGSVHPDDFAAFHAQRAQAQAQAHAHAHAHARAQAAHDPMAAAWRGASGAPSGAQAMHAAWSGAGHPQLVHQRSAPSVISGAGAGAGAGAGGMVMHRPSMMRQASANMVMPMPMHHHHPGMMMVPPPMHMPQNAMMAPALPQQRMAVQAASAAPAQATVSATAATAAPVSAPASAAAAPTWGSQVATAAPATSVRAASKSSASEICSVTWPGEVQSWCS